MPTVPQQSVKKLSTFKISYNLPYIPCIYKASSSGKFPSILPRQYSWIYLCVVSIPPAFELLNNPLNLFECSQANMGDIQLLT